MKRAIIIDTDPGQDDAMALMLAVKSGLFDIYAITTVSGNSTIENTTRNARYILNLLQSNIPVYSGAEKPLKRDLIQAVVHGKSGLDGINPINESKLTGNAVDKIVEIVSNSPNNITLITLGPLTNVALAIKKNKKVMSTLHEVIMMGGAIQVPGNKNRVAEFNFFIDPEAADIVFKFPIRKTIIPLDACNEVQLPLSDFEKIQNIQLQKVLLKMVKPYIENIEKDEGVKAALMYDPLTMYYLVNPGACKTYETNIQIETKGILTRGMSVADLRIKPNEKPNTTIVKSVNAQKFRQYFIKILSKK